MQKFIYILTFFYSGLLWGADESLNPLVTQSVSELCTVTTAGGGQDGFPKVKDIPSPNWENLDADEIVSKIPIHCDPKKGNTCYPLVPWYLLIHPGKEVKRAGHLIQIRLAEMLQKQFGNSKNLFEQLENQLNLTENEPKPRPKNQHDEHALSSFKYALSKHTEPMPDYKKDQLTFNAGAYLLCGPKNLFQCPKGLRQMWNWMDPTTIYMNYDSQRRVTAGGLIEVMQEILTEPQYERPLIKYALQINQLIQTAEKGETIDPSQHNFYNDLYESFLSEGYPPEKAENYTWNVMAYYGIRGASMYATSALTDAYTVNRFTALMVIFSGMTYLDAYTLSQKRAYSLPSSVVTTCMYGKSYHFWLTAYFARRLKDIGLTEKNRLLSARSAALAFEFGSQSRGRVDRKDQLKLKTFSVYNNNLRLNIAFSDLGALWGAQPKRHSLSGQVSERQASGPASQSLPPLSVDKQLHTIFNATQAVKPKSYTPVDKFFMWKKLMGSDHSLESVLNLLQSAD